MSESQINILWLFMILISPTQVATLKIKHPNTIHPRYTDKDQLRNNDREILSLFSITKLLSFCKSINCCMYSKKKTLLFIRYNNLISE